MSGSRSGDSLLTPGAVKASGVLQQSWRIYWVLNALAEEVLPAGQAGRVVVRTGAPAVEILETARALGTDLIVISTHGRTGFKHALMGSVAERVVQQAPCPVLVVREHEHEFVVE